MMAQFADFETKALYQNKENVVAVPCPYDIEILKALDRAQKKGICNGLLLGDTTLIAKYLRASELKESDFATFDIKDEQDSVDEAFKKLVSNDVQIVMKGIVHTNTFMHGLLKKKKELLSSSLVTHVVAFEISTRGLLFVSDPSILIEPTVEQKQITIQNAILLLQRLGVEEPKIAIISSVETPTQTISSSWDAQILSDSFRSSQTMALVDGPLAVDNAFSLEAKEKKNIKSDVAGRADVFIVPSLDAGNIFCKGLTYIAGFPSAGILAGTTKPVILTSRSAGAEERYHSLLLALAML